jgi:hypothetical protein
MGIIALIFKKRRKREQEEGVDLPSMQNSSLSAQEDVSKLFTETSAADWFTAHADDN